MATTTEASPMLEPLPGGGCIVVPGIDWHGYETILQVFGDRRIHVTYDRGTMEVRRPSQRHEQSAQLFGFFVFQVADELEMDYEPLGMTTWKRPAMEKGLEADQCYYILHAAIVRQKDELDLEVDPPPDLAIEIDITSSSLNRMAIYAELRVPELWRYDGESLVIYELLADGTYRPCATSPSFPGLRPAEVVRLIERGRTIPKRQWAREIREYVRAELINRRDGGRPGADGGPPPA
jgi:Uma2 family endonuclease